MERLQINHRLQIGLTMNDCSRLGMTIPVATNKHIIIEHDPKFETFKLTYQELKELNLFMFNFKKEIRYETTT